MPFGPAFALGLALTEATENTYPAGRRGRGPCSDPRELPPSFPALAVWFSQRPHQESFQ